MSIFKDPAIVVFSNSYYTQEFHEKMLNEAMSVMMNHTTRLTREIMENFKALREMVHIGMGSDNMDAKAELVIRCATSICHSGEES